MYYVHVHVYLHYITTYCDRSMYVLKEPTGYWCDYAFPAEDDLLLYEMNALYISNRDHTKLITSLQLARQNCTQGDTSCQIGEIQP